MVRSLPLFGLLLALAACGEEAKPDPRAERDPAVAAALDAPLMTDPELASQSRKDTVLSGGGPATAEIPPDKRSPEEAERARSDARLMFGGAPVPSAPGPAETTSESRLKDAATLEAAASALKLGPTSCPARLGYSFGWAAKLPAALPIYPRGHARVAAGTDESGCKLRAVRYVTPVGVSEVVDFYHALAQKGGLGPQHRKEGDDDVVSGRRGSAAYAVYVRQAPDGLTEVDLLTSGL